MTQESYTFNYLKIYLWQGTSVILNLLSMFIVMPRLASNPTVYGIYVVCVSANIFLTYADIGFASAGYKYASECYARKNLEDEIRIVAFVAFVLLLFVASFALAVSAIALSPGVLIKDIQSVTQTSIASRLLFILAFFSPLIIFQRVLDITYGVRLEQFVIQRIMIGASILKILSIFHFFQGARYDIVGYFLFCQIVNGVALLSCTIVAKIKYRYDFVLFIKAFKFSKPMFDKTKALAFGSLFLTVAWVLYYEIDAFAIAKLLGPDKVAVYAVGFMLLTYLRSFFGVLFNPFFARFNHFVGLADMEGLKSLYITVIALTLPFVVFPILSLFLLMEPFVSTWVGSHYENSVLMAQLLILCFIYAFISYPGSFLLMAQEKIKALRWTATTALIIYWSGIALTIHFIGLTSFALFKLVAMSCTGVMYFFITIRFLECTPGAFAKKILGPVAIPLVFVIVSLSCLKPFLPTRKSALNLFIVVTSGGLASAGALALYYLLSNHFRDYAHGLLRALCGRTMIRIADVIQREGHYERSQRPRNMTST